MNNLNNLYIDILRFGRDNIGKYIEFSDLKNSLKEKGYDTEELDGLIIQFLQLVFRSKVGSGNKYFLTAV
ncbi:MAG TPA: hypothetical protein VIK14_16850 [Ignavibacteria bacterium]